VTPGAQRSAVTGIGWPETVLGAFLAGTSGLAVVVHAFGPLPLRFTASFVVLPSAILLTGVVLRARRRSARLHAFARTLRVGATWGLAATLAYDAVRPLFKVAAGLTTDPYRAMPIFGHLITGRPPADPLALAVGWAYHFWNGITFGMVYALLPLPPGPLTGFAWAMVLQGLMMVVYPAFLYARLDDPGFLWTGLVGHGLWGLVLGAGVRRATGPARTAAPRAEVRP
jgi:hypothetical protein